MSSFVFLHIPTTISAIMGPYGYNEALGFFRYVSKKAGNRVGSQNPSLSIKQRFSDSLLLCSKYYQAPVVEAGLLASFMAHMVSGSMLYEKTNQEEIIAKEPWHVVLNRYAGRALMYLTPIHVLGTRIGSLLGKQRAADYDQVRSTLTGRAAIIFVPYYSVLAGAGVYHSMQGTFLALTRLGVLPASWFAKYSKNVLWLSYIAASLATTAAGIYSFSSIEGIPELAEYWQNHLPPILRIKK